MAYLSKLVKYETVGSDLFITHLNEIEVNNNGEHLLSIFIKNEEQQKNN